MPATTWTDLFRGRYAAYSAILCLGVTLHAINGLIATTAMPSAVAEIGGLAFYAWTTTVYMVASIMSAASGGLVKSAMGSRRGLIAAGLVFLAGSGICAAAWAMPVMLVGRSLQGAGGGMIVALIYTVVRDLFPTSAWSRAFALMSLVWGAAALAGPLFGGFFAEFGYWRMSFFTMVPVALVFVATARLALPPLGSGGGKARYPWVRLALLGTAIIMAATAGNIGAVPWQAGLLAGALLLLSSVLWIDASQPHKILPSAPFSLRTPVGAGLASMLTLMIATWGFTIYGPLLLQLLHGLTPITAGFFVAFESVSWTIAAVAVAGLPERRVPLAIVAGPIIATAGTAGIALFLASGPLAVVGIAVFLAGAGLGVCWAFLSKAVMGFSREGEGDVAAASIVTVQMTGAALGSALVGLTANTLGFADGATPESATAVAFWVHAALLPVLAIAIAVAFRLAAMTRALPAPASE